MKKLFIVLLALCMLYSIAMAEEITEYNWADYESAFSESGIEADFVSFEDAGIKMLIPRTLPEQELSEDDIASFGLLFKYADEAEENYITMTRVNFDSLTNYGNVLKMLEFITDIRQVTVNGIPALIYQTPVNDSMSIAFINQAGTMLEVTVCPLSAEGAETVWAMIISSIQSVE